MTPHYHRARHLVTIPRTRLTVAMIGVMSLLYVWPRLMDRIYRVEGDDEDGNVCFVQMAPWVEYLSKEVYFSSFFW